jgi:hypothetical protein
MRAFFVAFATVLHERVWLSYKSTFIGLGLTLIGEALNYTLNTVPDPRVHALCALLTTIFVAWKDKKVKEGSAKLLGFVIFFVALGAQAAGGTPGARTAQAAVSGGTIADVAQSDPLPEPPPVTPAHSGCLKNGKLCFGPTFSLTVAAINLTTKKVEGSFAPGIGVGMTLNPGLWSSVGVDFYLNLDPGAQNASGAILVKLLNGYVRAGYSKGFIGDTSHRLLFGTGIDL